MTKKLQRAVTGGGTTLEEHRKKGADIKKDMVFELLKQHLIESDTELQKIYDNYSSGDMLSSEIKQIAIEKMTAFMNVFEKDLKKAQKIVPKLTFIKGR